MHGGLTEAVFDEVIKGVAIAIVGELVVGGRKLLEALRGDAGEISGELCVLGQNHSASSHEAVDQRLLPHLETITNPNPTTECEKYFLGCLLACTYLRTEIQRYRDDGIEEREMLILRPTFLSL